MSSLLRPLVALVCLVLVCAANARPYASFSGLVAAADNAVTASTNPAGISRFEESAYQVELLTFFSESTWEGQLGDSGSTSKSTESSEMVVPVGYLVLPINEDLTFGFTVLGAGFSDDLGDWPGRYFIQSYDSINISAFPSLAYQLNDKLSIAASLTLTYSIYDQTRAVANLADPGYPDGSAELETDGVDVGFGLSMLYQISDRTRWGIAYLSEVNPTLEGKSKYRGLGPNTTAVLEEAGVLGATVEVKSRTPQSVIAGVYHEFTNRHAFTVDVAWVDFSRFQLSEFYFDGEGLSENLGEYQDILAVSAGYSWPLSARWMLGVGGLYIDDMVDDDDRIMTLRLDSIWSAGVAAEWQWTDSRALQIGLNYMSGGNAPVTTPDIPGIGSAIGEFTSRDTIFLRLGLTFGGL